MTSSDGCTYPSFSPNENSHKEAPQNTWFTNCGGGSASQCATQLSSRASRRWVETDDTFVTMKGECWGFSDLWVPLLRSFFLVWFLWAVHLTQTLREATDVTAAARGAVQAGASKVGQAGLLPAGEWGARENRLLWLGLWLLCFLVALIGRHV